MFSVPMLLVLTMSACSVVSAFVVPLQSRPSFLLNAFSRDPVTQAGEGKRSDGRHMQMRYIAMNRFKIKPGCEDEFEKVWRERESKLQNFSGFEQFMMLKIDHGDDVDAEEGETAAAKIGYTEFISHTTWAHQLDFDEWRRSQEFKTSHVQSKIGDLVVGRPEPGLYNAVIMEPTPPEHTGDLFDFENEPSYFDGDM